MLYSLSSKYYAPYKVFNLVATILGIAAGAATLYIVARDDELSYLRKHRRSSTFEDTFYVAGLKNIGNSCYFNAILQALASCSSFFLFLQRSLLANESVAEVRDERVPLTVALTLLLEALCNIEDDKIALNPQRVMSALSLYVTDFELAHQQDAAEALLHLLSSLEEELSKCYVSSAGSVSNISDLTCRIKKPMVEDENEFERWRQYSFGPFNGIMGSKLSCISCLSMISMDLDFFHCLPLPPVLHRDTNPLGGCIMDCLKCYTATEIVEGYFCNRCWHLGALKFLLLEEEKDEQKIKLLSECVNPDSCDCKRHFRQEDITWTGFSHAVKQLGIIRCPKILCLQLQRASVNVFGESIKLGGHISFPLVLDVFPFTEAGKAMEVESSDDMVKQNHSRHLVHQFFPQLLHSSTSWQIKDHLQPSHSLSPHNVATSSTIYEVPGDGASTGALLTNNKGQSLVSSCILAENNTEPYGETSIAIEMVASGLNNCQATIFRPMSTKKTCLYRLTSVVEHYGVPSQGHYAVYRRVKVEVDSGHAMGVINNHQWFYISDNKVSRVSEETVLAAEACLLFYERIEASL